MVNNINTKNKKMDFIKSLLPAEWSMRFFEPETDTQPGAHIYLHVMSTDSVFRFRQGVSRYDVVEFLKEIHDNSELTKEEFIETASRLFMVNTILNDKDAKHLLGQFEPFRRQSIIFMRDSILNMEHDKNENNEWITSIFKQFGTDETNKPVALITNSDTLDAASI